MQLLEKTEQGRQILKRFSELKQTFEKAKGYLDLDRLKAKGERLLREIKE
jgi:heme-degrading monooxygenase HmoA